MSAPGMMYAAGDTYESTSVRRRVRQHAPSSILLLQFVILTFYWRRRRLDSLGVATGSQWKA